MEDTKSWECPYCRHRQILSWRDCVITSNNMVSRSEHGEICFSVVSIACLHEKCKKLTLTFILYDKNEEDLRKIKSWSLLPESKAKPQPQCIPKFIVQDYEEACKIVHLSPKASAVMARRCLETMIKDFCGIKENTLYQAIEKLKNKLEKGEIIPGVMQETMDALNGIRQMGKIGAHMQVKTGMVVDIEPEESTLLIELIEMLFKDWYIARYKRQERLKSIQTLTAQKEQQGRLETKNTDVQTSH